ncbi:radical SAM peptide maturase, CXXX-repeat target family [Clostridium sp. Marseille-QA1073]
MNNTIKMTSYSNIWKGNKNPDSIKDITFCVTEDCNLACKYCYMTGKNQKKKMTFEIAKKSVDYILENKDFFNEDSVVWNFIGGEPFLEIDLIDKVCDYIKFKMFDLDHPWFDSYRFSFSTNGILYNSEKVQKYIKKNRKHISIGISIDGNKKKHDLQRVYKNGSGSYDDVMQNADLWKSQFKGVSTKATFSSGDLPYLKDSIISLWENGIKEVSANVVFEDVWKEGDDIIFEKQLDELGDYILENKLWDEYYVRFFEPHIGNKLNKSDLDKGVCGSGKMLAIDCEGNFFPCIRFLDFSLSNRNGLSIGNIYIGVIEDSLRPFKALSFKEISDNECLNCEVASGCSWCVGYNYDEYGTIFSRAKHICKMHKANVRANKRFWRKYEVLTGNKSPRRDYEGINDRKFLQVMLDDNIVSTCLYDVNKQKDKNKKMSKELFEKAINFALNNDYEVVLLGESRERYLNKKNCYTNIVSTRCDYIDDKSIIIYDNFVSTSKDSTNGCILRINKDNIKNLCKYVEKLSVCNKRINIILQNISDWNEKEFDEYSRELDKVIELTSRIYKENKTIEINVLTDILNLEEHYGCDAGENSITLGPDGNFYICPAFYFDKIGDILGNIETGINEDLIKNNLKIDSSPVCKVCDSNQCKQCKYLNKKYTGEYKIPPKNQCVISHIERNKSKILKEQLKDVIKSKDFSEIEYNDPLIMIGVK